jgi:hypothetical protein
MASGFLVKAIRDLLEELMDFMRGVFLALENGQVLVEKHDI